MSSKKQKISNKNSIALKKWEDSLIILEKEINYIFKNKQFLRDALTHKSFFENSKLNKSEKMEFLGDSVLELIVTESLYEIYPNKNEGQLTKIRSKIISSIYLFQISQRLKLYKYILVDEHFSLADIKKNVSICADTMESFFCAIFLDSSYYEAKYVISNIIFSDWKSIIKTNPFTNFKSILQEWSHSELSLNPAYHIIKEQGPDHKKNFFVQVETGSHKAKGNGKSKKLAEQMAAKNLLKKLKINIL
ncbi:MAG: ribonuclease III [Candidatus Cloacimonadota bacterium]|nr:ribonuclease III [Candidatus Cloacimonadota bacterium]